jgi:metal-sulfur cluster biosynthetic enzyme
LTESEDKVREAVDKVIDPETGLTFAEMHMITSVKEEEPGVEGGFCSFQSFLSYRFQVGYGY